MTLAALAMSGEAADDVIARFRAATGITGEVKGSRINPHERALLFDLLEAAQARAVVSVAISAVKAQPGENRGALDLHVYERLLADAIGTLLPETGGCVAAMIDDGRYGPETLAQVRSAIAEQIGGWGTATLELSHRSSGLQIADVIANTFFTRALPGDRQVRMDALVAPWLESGRIKMRILPDF